MILHNTKHYAGVVARLLKNGKISVYPINSKKKVDKNKRLAWTASQTTLLRHQDIPKYILQEEDEPDEDLHTATNTYSPQIDEDIITRGKPGTITVQLSGPSQLTLTLNGSISGSNITSESHSLKALADCLLRAFWPHINDDMSTVTIHTRQRRFDIQITGHRRIGRVVLPNLSKAKLKTFKQDGHFPVTVNILAQNFHVHIEDLSRRGYFPLTYNQHFEHPVTPNLYITTSCKCKVNDEKTPFRFPHSGTPDQKHHIVFLMGKDDQGTHFLITTEESKHTNRKDENGGTNYAYEDGRIRIHCENRNAGHTIVRLINPMLGDRKLGRIVNEPENVEDMNLIQRMHYTARNQRPDEEIYNKPLDVMQQEIREYLGCSFVCNQPLESLKVMLEKNTKLFHPGILEPDQACDIPSYMLRDSVYECKLLYVNHPLALQSFLVYPPPSSEDTTPSVLVDYLVDVADTEGSHMSLPSSLVSPYRDAERKPRKCVKPPTSSRKRKNHHGRDGAPKHSSTSKASSSKTPKRTSSDTTTTITTSTTTKSHSITLECHKPLVSEPKKDIHEQLSTLQKALEDDGTHLLEPKHRKKTKKVIKKLTNIAAQLTDQLTNLMRNMSIIDTSTPSEVSPLTEPVHCPTSHDDSSLLHLRGGGDPDPPDHQDDTEEHTPDQPTHKPFRNNSSTPNPYATKTQTRYDGPERGRIKARETVLPQSLHHPDINTHPSKLLCKLLTSEPDDITYKAVAKLTNYEQRILVMSKVHQGFCNHIDGYDSTSQSNLDDVQDLGLKCSTKYILSIIKNEIPTSDGEPRQYERLHEEMTNERETYCNRVDLDKTSPVDFAKYATINTYPRDDDRDSLIDACTIMGTSITKNYYEHYHRAICELPKNELMSLAFFPGRFVSFLLEAFPATQVALPSPISDITPESLPFYEYPDEIGLETLAYAPAKWLRLDIQKLDNMDPVKRKSYLHDIMYRLFRVIAPRNALTITKRFVDEPWTTQRTRLSIPGELTRSLSGTSDPEHFQIWVWNSSKQAKILRNYSSPEKKPTSLHNTTTTANNQRHTTNKRKSKATKLPGGICGDHGMKQSPLTQSTTHNRGTTHPPTNHNPGDTAPPKPPKAQPARHDHDLPTSSALRTMTSPGDTRSANRVHFSLPPPSAGTVIPWNSRGNASARRQEEELQYNVQVRYSTKQPDRGQRYLLNDHALDCGQRLFSSLGYEVLKEPHRQRRLSHILPINPEHPILARSKDVNFAKAASHSQVSIQPESQQATLSFRVNSNFDMTTLDSADGIRNSAAYKKMEEALQKHPSLNPEITITTISRATKVQAVFLVGSSLSDCRSQVNNEMRARFRAEAARKGNNIKCPAFSVEFAHACITTTNGEFMRSNGYIIYTDPTVATNVSTLAESIQTDYDKFMFPATYNYECVSLLNSSGATKAITLQEQHYQHRVQFRLRRAPHHPSAQITTYSNNPSGMTVQQLILTQESFQMAPGTFSFNPIEKISVGNSTDSIIIETRYEHQHIVESLAMSRQLTDFLATQIHPEWKNSILDQQPIPTFKLSPHPTGVENSSTQAASNTQMPPAQKLTSSQDQSSTSHPRQLFMSPQQPEEDQHEETHVSVSRPTNTNQSSSSSCDSSDTSTTLTTQRLLVPSSMTRPPRKINDLSTPPLIPSKSTTTHKAHSEPIMRRSSHTNPDKSSNETSSSSSSTSSESTKSQNKNKRRKKDIDIIVTDEKTNRSCIIRITDETGTRKVVTTAKSKLAIDKYESRFLYYNDRCLIREKVKQVITDNETHPGITPTFTLFSVLSHDSDSTDDEKKEPATSEPTQNKNDTSDAHKRKSPRSTINTTTEKIRKSIEKDNDTSESEESVKNPSKSSPPMKQTKLKEMFTKTPTPTKAPPPEQSNFTIKPVTTESLTEFLITSMHATPTHTRLVTSLYEQIRTLAGVDMVGKNGFPASVEEFVEYMHDNSVDKPIHRMWIQAWGVIHLETPMENRDHSAKTCMAIAAYNEGRRKRNPDYKPNFDPKPSWMTNKPTQETLNNNPKPPWMCKKPAQQTTSNNPKPRNKPQQSTPTPNPPEGPSPWVIDRQPKPNDEPEIQPGEPPETTTSSNNPETQPNTNDELTDLSNKPPKTTTPNTNPDTRTNDTTEREPQSNAPSTPPDPDPQDEQDNYDEHPEPIEDNDSDAFYENEDSEEEEEEDSDSTGFPLL